jgi:hypothetical protein
MFREETYRTFSKSSILVGQRSGANIVVRDMEPTPSCLVAPGTEDGQMIAWNAATRRYEPVLTTFIKLDRVNNSVITGNGVKVVVTNLVMGIAGDGWIYWGDPNTNGVWRSSNKDGAARMQQRVNNVWVDKIDIVGELDVKNLVMAPDGCLYFGDPNTDGTKRIRSRDDGVAIEEKKGEIWDEITSFNDT